MDRYNKLTYWFPLVLPMLMGMILAFAKLSADFSETTTLVGSHEVLAQVLRDSDLIDDDALKAAPASGLLVDGERFLRRLSEGVVLSIIAVDIWAFTTLFGAASGPRRRLPYEYPVLGIIAHFLLVLAAAASDSLGIKGSTAYTLIGSVIVMLTAFAVGWWVRHGVWAGYEKPSNGEGDQKA